MEIVYFDKRSDYFAQNKITGFYGDVLDLLSLGVDINGITYDDKWSVAKFLKGHKLGIKARIESIFSYLEIDPNIINLKLGELSKSDFKFVLLAKALLLNKENLVFEYFDIGLSYKDQKRLLKIMRMLKKDGKTIVVLSNDLVFLANIVETILVYKDGKIVYDGSINDLSKLDITEDMEITKFIKEANKKGAKLDYTLDAKELLKDIYRSVC